MEAVTYPNKEMMRILKNVTGDMGGAVFLNQL